MVPIIIRLSRMNVLNMNGMNEESKDVKDEKITLVHTHIDLKAADMTNLADIIILLVVAIEEITAGFSICMLIIYLK